MGAVGYSGKPLAEKLGLKPGDTVHVLGVDIDYALLVGPASSDITVVVGIPQEPVRFMHWFVTSREELSTGANEVVRNLAPGGTLWLSWPKKSSKVPTDVIEDTLREVLLPLGIVDVKVCAVDETWSGLKFLWRKK